MVVAWRPWSRTCAITAPKARGARVSRIQRHTGTRARTLHTIGSTRRPNSTNNHLLVCVVARAWMNREGDGEKEGVCCREFLLCCAVVPVESIVMIG